MSCVEVVSSRSPLESTVYKDPPSPAKVILASLRLRVLSTAEARISLGVVNRPCSPVVQVCSVLHEACQPTAAPRDPTHHSVRWG